MQKRGIWSSIGGSESDSPAMTSTTPYTTLAELGEEAVVSRLVSGIPDTPGVIAGPGDDCAVIDTGASLWQLLKTDCVVEGVHFFPGTDSRLVGRKAMNRVLSDIAAMGGTPAHALVTLATDSGRAFSEVEGWQNGLLEAATAAGCSVVGGETSRLPVPGAVITISMTGTVEPERCLFRSGAKPGDLIAVTGKLGGSLASGRHLSFVPRLVEARWLAANAQPTAMMDLSDGLGSDLPRLAAASGTGFRIDEERLPCHAGVSPRDATRDGEDYELLLTFSPDAVPGWIGRWREHFPGLDLTIIGQMTEPDHSIPLERGWEHYRQG